MIKFVGLDPLVFFEDIVNIEKVAELLLLSNKLSLQENCAVKTSLLFPLLYVRNEVLDGWVSQILHWRVVKVYLILSPEKSNNITTWYVCSFKSPDLHWNSWIHSMLFQFCFWCHHSRKF